MSLLTRSVVMGAGQMAACFGLLGAEDGALSFMPMGARMGLLSPIAAKAPKFSHLGCRLTRPQNLPVKDSRPTIVYCRSPCMLSPGL